MDIDIAFKIPEWVLLVGGGFGLGIVATILFFVWATSTPPRGGMFK